MELGVSLMRAAPPAFVGVDGRTGWMKYHVMDGLGIASDGNDGRQRDQKY
jgi:hypothetical protein